MFVHICGALRIGIRCWGGDYCVCGEYGARDAVTGGEATVLSVSELCSNLLFVLPWCIVCQVVDLSAGDAWMYQRVVFRRSLVFTLVDVVI